ncbi:beta-1,6-N-acetylglucosaminyltransferase [Sphingobacterium hungaricum]|uniref:Peptide O-xylosyltransferase n=1 Tax=Sphingobacterium hungaricum TaxID=2082723 RepID=A0A928UXM8_9SPHI|nr:beta-1,6-N-acetylglucosaminyltransferase [Sphingobacterium hungaricum]MBE8712667.1 glycosyl transferase [Sphingobacterium hungaricum]
MDNPYKSFDKDGLNLLNGSETVKIAYFIMVHRLPKQFVRLFSAIYDVNNFYLIHVDKKADKNIEEELNSYLKNYKNVAILKSEDVIWGGYSMVQAELEGIKYLLNLSVDWDYFINLSGQDFPLKSQNIIKQFLFEHRGASFLKYENQKEVRPDTMNRIENFFEEIDGEISVKTHPRFYLENTTPYIGGQWMMLTRDCCKFVCNSPEVKKYEYYYLNTLIADESFFQTVLMNSSFDGALINDDKRAIIWIPDGLIKLRPKTFSNEDLTYLLNSNSLFARKFDDNIDSNIINKLMFHINEPMIRVEFDEMIGVKSSNNRLC